MKKNTINLLITGGAGFIGSSLVEYFLQHQNVALVRVLDDLSSGYYENIQEFENHSKLEFIQGDITHYITCQEAMQGIDIVSHHAALGSIPRSIDNPMRTNEVNVGGTLNILYAAKEAGIERVILAFSSSTYGDSTNLPKVEGEEGSPLSPYAISKMAIEHYARVFHATYGLNYIGLRYFNIFGPRQNPDNPYAAVIPLFCKAFREGKRPVINGDGTFSRDFTYIANVIQANEKAVFTENEEALNEVYNCACGNQITLNEVVSCLQEISGKDLKPIFGAVRPGDMPHSRADIQKITEKLNYEPIVNFKRGLEFVYNSFEEVRAEKA